MEDMEEDIQLPELQALKQRPVQAPAGLADRMLAGVHAHRKRRRRRRGLVTGLSLAAAASLALALFLKPASPATAEEFPTDEAILTYFRETPRAWGAENLLHQSASELANESDAWTEGLSEENLDEFLESELTTQELELYLTL